MMATFKAIPMTELAQVIPGWKELAKKNPADTDNLAKMFETLDDYAQQNNMNFFQVHHRRFDDTTVAIFKMKE
jgi:hypothetical protein